MKRAFLDAFAIVLLAITVFVWIPKPAPPASRSISATDVTTSAPSGLVQPRRVGLPSAEAVGDPAPAILPTTIALEHSSSEHKAGWVMIHEETVSLTPAELAGSQFASAGKYRVEISSEIPVAAGFGDVGEIFHASSPRALSKYKYRVDPSKLRCGAIVPAKEVSCDLTGGEYFFVQDHRGWAEYAGAGISAKTTPASAIAIAKDFRPNLTTIRIFQFIP